MSLTNMIKKNQSVNQINQILYSLSFTKVNNMRTKHIHTLIKHSTRKSLHTMWAILLFRLFAFNIFFSFPFIIFGEKNDGLCMHIDVDQIWPDIITNHFLPSVYRVMGMDYHQNIFHSCSVVYLQNKLYSARKHRSSIPSNFIHSRKETNIEVADTAL